MSSKAITVRGLGKKYLLHHERGRENYVAMRDVISQTVRGVFQPNKVKKSSDEVFWALRNVTFDVAEGEPLGIIGRNGAGKSTLLKIISRITEPTTGRIEINGRVASLLEVGTGFHPELTGRENIYMNGAILGMRRTEIRQKFDEIVDFAGVERFLDTPVKRYSSGMYVRLAFAVAAHLEPEILVVDEVLAVGDAGFQRKCLGKMNDIASSGGRTVLFVSHQLDMIRTLCRSCVMLEKGKVAQIGPASEVVDFYLKSSVADTSSAEYEAEEKKDLPGQILRARVCNDAGETKSSFDVFDDVILEVEYILREPAEGMIVSMKLRRNDQMFLMTFDSDADESRLEKREPGIYRAKVRIPAPLFKSGNYSVLLNLGIVNTDIIHEIDNAVQFDVDLLSKPSAFLSCAPKRPGVVSTMYPWETELIGPA